MSLAGIPRATRFPRMVRVKQQFPGPMLHDVAGAVRRALGEVPLPVRPGQSVALTAGSRGIVNIDVVVRAPMGVVRVGEVLGLPIWLDRHAAEADWIGVINRVKPHTGFSGEIGSGLLKMMTIGMGKHRGAGQAHRANIRLGYAAMITALGREMLRAVRIAFGLGIVENGYDETALVRALLPGELEAGERELLGQAKAWMAK